MISNQEYLKFQENLKKTQEESAQVIQRLDKTIQGVKETIASIQQTDNKYITMKRKFENVIEKLAGRIAGSLVSDPLKIKLGKTYQDLPQELSPKEVVKRMLKHQEIVIMTGAGVSAPSGIPTFRGTNGLYSKKFSFQGHQYDPEEFITNKFYEQHPEAIWEWKQHFYQMVINHKPNQIHFLIHRLAQSLGGRGKKVTLVTQNIDDLHLKPEKDQYQYNAIHGNIKMVRCKNNHLHSYADFRKQIIEGIKVRCPKCQELLRPHALFFDECYGPLYGGSLLDKTFPFAIVIGTSLATRLCHDLTARASEVIEINPEPVIEVGKVYQFKKDTVKALESLLLQMGESKE